MSKYLFLASERELDHDFCRKVAERAGLIFMPVISLSGFEAQLNDNPKCLFFWDIDFPDIEKPTHRYSLSHLTPILARHLKPQQVFGLADRSMFELSAAHRQSVIAHFCVRHYSEFAVEWISEVCAPLFNHGPFGLDHYKEPGSVTQAVQLKRSTDRKQTLMAVDKLLRKHKFELRSREMVISSVDELLMNAILDAPIDETGIRYRREVDISSDFIFTEKEYVTMSVLVNTRSIVIGVFDHFGSFPTPAPGDLMRKDYSRANYKVDPTTKSAGLGLRGISASGICTIISCQKDYGTEAVIGFPYYKSFKETKKGFRSFSLNILG